MSANTTPAEYRLYQYTPSLTGAIVAVVIFTCLTAAHIWMLRKHKTLYFTPFIFGGIFEIIGYAGRIWSYKDVNSIGGFVMQALLILLAPALFAASIYMILGRLLRRINAESLSMVPPRIFTKVFVTGDVLSFSMQLVGGGLQAAGSLDLLTTGRRIIIAGLAIQIAFFSLFVATAVLVHWRFQSIQDTEVPWKRHLWVLYATSILILVRSIFRVAEYAEGNTGYLISHEIFLYMLDTLLMIAVMTILLVWYTSGLDKVDQYAHGRPANSKPISLDQV